MQRRGSDAALLAEFVASFEKRGDLDGFDVPPLLLTHTDEYGVPYWKPRPITTTPAALDALYYGLGLTGTGSTRFPPLYEALLLSYRWAEVDLGDYRLMANEPAEDFSPLLSVMRSDRFLYATVVPNGYVPFGRGPDLNYDALCFDFRQRREDGDCRVVRLEHEAILCEGRIGDITELAPSFRALVRSTIARSAAQ